MRTWGTRCSSSSIRLEPCRKHSMRSRRRIAPAIKPSSRIAPAKRKIPSSRTSPWRRAPDTSRPDRWRGPNGSPSTTSCFASKKSLARLPFTAPAGAASSASDPEDAMAQLNKFSARVTQPKSQGASQAMLYGTGLTDADMDKPQVGISSVWFEGNPCNMHLLDLAEHVKEGVAAAGMVGMRFNTVGVSDAISMGTDGMSFSLQSRDLIADSIETVMAGQWY